jgi:predicted site-specific integrase-resolvase
MQLTRKEEAAALGISERTLRRWRAAGKLPLEAIAVPCWCGKAVLCMRVELTREEVTYEGTCWCHSLVRETRRTGL